MAIMSLRKKSLFSIVMVGVLTLCVLFSWETEAGTDETVIASGNLATSRRTIMGVLGQCRLFGIEEAGTREIFTRAGLPSRALEELDFPISLDQELEICNALVRTLAARH